eukprot:SAG31_NODE_336_length_17493_cov_20.694032_2_plen_150_part_00
MACRQAVSESDEFTSKIVLVTGGAMGIGRAIVEAFAARAATVVYADLTECLQQGVEPIAGKLNTETGLASGRMVDDGNRITWVPCDVSDAAQVEAAVKHTVATHGRIDVLVRKPTLVPAEKGAICCSAICCSKNCSCQRAACTSIGFAC